MFVGEDHGTICWNTPYRQAYLELVEKVVRDYDVDGLYFDRWTIGYFWPGRAVCYCDGCRNGFRKAAGLELPWHERDTDYTAAELAAIDRYHSWYQDNLVEIARQVRKLVKSYKNIPLIYNVADPIRMANEDPRIRDCMDGTLYERGNSILERAEGVTLARAAGRSVWPYVGEYNNWPRLEYNGFDFQQQIFTDAMFGGGSILALPWGYVRHAANRRFVEYPFGVIKQHEAVLAGLQNCPYAAVVYGYQDPAGHAETGTWWKTDVRTSSLGAFAALLYGHVQVASVPESLLDDTEGLRPYKVLYLADVTHLTEKRMENVRRFVRDGGGLVASYAASLYDAPPNAQAGRLLRYAGGFVRSSGPSAFGTVAARRRSFALEDLFRVRPVQPAHEVQALLAEHKSMTGGPSRSVPGRSRPCVARHLDAPVELSTREGSGRRRGVEGDRYRRWPPADPSGRRGIGLRQRARGLLRLRFGEPIPPAEQQCRGRIPAQPGCEGNSGTAAVPKSRRLRP